MTAQNKDLSELDQVSSVEAAYLMYVVQAAGVFGNYATAEQVATYVHTENTDEVSTIKGDQSTDGSLRLIPDPTHSGEHIAAERRTNGVWNLGGFDFSGDLVVSFGANLSLGAGGNHLRTYNESQDDYATYAHRHYSDTAGSAESHDDPVLGPRNSRVIIQPDDSGEMSGSSIQWTFSFSNIGSETMLAAIYLQVATSATADATFYVRRNSHSGGVAFYKNISKDDLVADAELNISVDGWIEEFGIETLYCELDCGAGTVGLKSNVGTTAPWQALDYYNEEHQHLATMETLANNFVIDGSTNKIMLSSTTNPQVMFFKPTFGEEGLH